MKKLLLVALILLLVFSFGCAKKSDAAYVIFKGERINLNTTEFAQKADYYPNSVSMLDMVSPREEDVTRKEGYAYAVLLVTCTDDIIQKTITDEHFAEHVKNNSQLSQTQYRDIWEITFEINKVLHVKDGIEFTKGQELKVESVESMISDTYMAEKGGEGLSLHIGQFGIVPSVPRIGYQYVVFLKTTEEKTDGCSGYEIEMEWDIFEVSDDDDFQNYANPLICNADDPNSKGYIGWVLKMRKLVFEHYGIKVK